MLPSGSFLLYVFDRAFQICFEVIMIIMRRQNVMYQPKERIVVVLLSNFKSCNSLIFVMILCLVALIVQFIDVIGFVSICLFSIISYIYFNVKFEQSGYNYIVTLIFVAIVWLFITHNVKGFSNPIIFDRVQVSLTSTHYSMRINLDKAITALIIFLMHRNNNSTINLSRDQLIKTMRISSICIATIMFPALFVGYVRFDPKIPDIAVIWMLNNLLCVCFSEEVVFRLYLQQRLNSLIENSIVSIMIASAMFGFYHYYMIDSVVLAVLSSICGVFYGIVFSKTNNNVACSIITHFLLNLIHLLFFSYPCSVKIC